MKAVGFRVQGLESRECRIEDSGAFVIRRWLKRAGGRGVGDAQTEKEISREK